VLFWLILAFTVVPAVELLVLLSLGSWLGPLPTFLIVLLTGILGASLAKQEGLGVLRSLQVELAQGLPPASHFAEGALVFAGGLLLVTPGVFTDVAGFLFILPWSRRWIAPRLIQAVSSRVDLRSVNIGGSATTDGGASSAGPSAPSPDAPKPFSNPFDDLP
jgi:UPF0716 protein FxsA